MPILTYKEKPKQVEAVMFDGSNHDEVKKLIGDTRYQENNGMIFIMTIDMFRENVHKGDYVVKYSPGRYDVFSKAKFEMNYEKE